MKTLLFIAIVFGVEFQRKNIQHLDEVICNLQARLDKKEGNDV